MRVVIRGKRGRLGTWGSFSFSGLVHGAILAWLAFGSASLPPEPRRSLYDMEIRPGEHHIVWYSLRNRLPDVTPAGPRDPRPPRARFKFSQTLVAGKKEDDRPPQMIWTPAPEVHPPKPLPLPNVVAVTAAPQPVRAFTPPPAQRAAATPGPLLPQAPKSRRPSTVTLSPSRRRVRPDRSGALRLRRQRESCPRPLPCPRRPLSPPRRSWVGPPRSTPPRCPHRCGLSRGRPRPARRRAARPPFPRPRRFPARPVPPKPRSRSPD